jgi:GTP-binding protein
MRSFRFKTGEASFNMRASGSDDAVLLTPHVQMTLEDCISYINDDELVEITPKSIRLRKMLLGGLERKRAKNAAA